MHGYARRQQRKVSRGQGLLVRRPDWGIGPPPVNGCPQRIAYKDGAQHREYMPDLLVVITDDIRWIIEGKAADE
jgi:hypothetical protein